MTQEQLLWRIIEKLNEGINSQHETIKFLMEKRIEQRQWVGLTEEEIEPTAEQADNYAAFHHGVSFAEAKLKEKNGG